MVPIQAAIAALRSAAAADGVSRVTAQITCVLRSDNHGKAEFWAASDNDAIRKEQCHSVTIEVVTDEHKNLPVATARSGPVPTATPPKPPSSKSLVRDLSQVFGEPGFDSSARASVFVEIMEALAPLQVASLIESFRSDPAEVPILRPGDAAVATARTRVTRLVKLGPAGLEGVPRLVSMLEENTLADVLNIVRNSWKSQESWIDTNPPGARADSPSAP